ncbi:hypothetical protein [Sphingomonas aracearum]|uniref:Uncharacterized protein n=1 Tax=Sphingomonas aracearum TaxID=2283317 RepID=A0A369VTZ0_9SPHN|nr:hypothetical protein [Sphingomonas aracearum]RDE05828.1 hypothetical protein DVW87_11590 [Sphingomonas aracearum]
MLILSFLLANAVAMPVVKPGMPFCDKEPLTVAQGGVPARARPLGEEPPARRLLAVADLDTDGCLKPRIISEQVGPPARR